MSERRSELSIDGMHCVTCSKTIEKAVKKNPGIHEAMVHFASGTATIDYDPSRLSEEAIIQSIREVGYDARPLHEERLHPLDERNVITHFSAFFISFLLSIPLILEMVGGFLGIHEKLPVWMMWLLATVIQFWCGYPFYKNSYFALRAKSSNMDVLIALGTSAAYFYSLFVVLLGLSYPLYFETSALIITLVLLGRYLETRTKAKAKEAIQKLLLLKPKSAFVKRNGQFIEIPAGEVQRGDLFQLRPGEAAVVDGIVVEGESAIDESTLTGESFPLFKAPGSKVFAGTHNTTGSLLVEATFVGADTILSRIIRTVEQAQNSRAPIQRLADEVSSYFVPGVVLFALLTFLGWLFAGGSLTTALINAVSVLVVACPCALGLATPTVIMVASGRAANLGILFKEAKALEIVEKMQLLVLDKTGTLTRGHPLVEHVVLLDTLSKQELISVAASLAHHSTHPLSQAILEYAKIEHLPIEPVTDFNSVPGKGIIGVKRSIRYTLGSPRMVEEAGHVIPTAEIEKEEMRGRMVLFVTTEKSVLGYFVIEDEMRENSKRAVDLLKALPLTLILLTGDSERAAKALASDLKIGQYYAQVLPEEKAAIIQRLKDQQLKVGMVGDGVNDVPALATADVGFAIDYGSDIAIDTADITLLNGDLMGVLKAIHLSRATMRKIRENLFFAFFYNILGIPFAALGLLTPLIAATAMAASSISVISNALLLKRWKPDGL